MHSQAMQSFEAAWQGVARGAAPKVQASQESRATAVQDMHSPMGHTPTGAMHMMQSRVLVTGYINSPGHSRELSQQQKEIMPQIGLKAKLQHGSKVHPANRAKSRTGDKLQHMHGVHPRNTLPTSMSKIHAGDRAGDRDIPNAAQAQTGFPGLS